MWHAMINAILRHRIPYTRKHSYSPGRVEEGMLILLLVKVSGLCPPHCTDLVSLVLRNVGCKLVQNVPGSDFD